MVYLTNISAQILEEQRKRAELGNRIVMIFNEVGRDYAEAEVATFEVHAPIRDVHAFYRLIADTSKVVHVQSYPGMSTPDNMRVWARMMDYKRMHALRTTLASIGNEHEAVIQRFPAFGSGIIIPYDKRILEAKLAESVPALRI